MDFSVPGSDSWHSTPAGNDLLSNYFGQQQEFAKVAKNNSGNMACSSGSSRPRSQKRKKTPKEKHYQKQKFGNSDDIKEMNSELKNEFSDSYGTGAKFLGKRKQFHENYSKHDSINEKSSDCDVSRGCVKKQKKTRQKKIGGNEDELDEPSEVEYFEKLEKEYLEKMGKSYYNKTTFIYKAEQKLQAAKFRYLNEKLYTETGKNSCEYFRKNKQDFMNYHLGYRSQVSKWPINPVDLIIENIQKLSSSAIIADLGCGDAKISQIFPHRTVHSFDIMALNKNVVSCDIAHTPLTDESVNVAVFCLSLMGTNVKDFIYEAHRILKLQGTLKIVEVESRIEDEEQFVKCIKCFGFNLKEKRTCSKMFIFFDFTKVKAELNKQKAPNIALKPCLYKKR